MKDLSFCKAVNTPTAFFVAVLFLMAGCTTTPGKQERATARGIRLGEEVQITYTCRLKTGEVVATNETEVARDPAVPKSQLFVPRTCEPLVVLAGGIPDSVARQKEATPWLSKLKGLEPEVETRIADRVVGLEPGKRHEVEIDSEVPEGLTMPERIVEFARKKKIRFEKTRVDLEAFKERFGEGERPEVGRVVFPEADVPLFFTVLSVDEAGVEIQASAIDGGVVPGPLGPEVYHAKGDHLFERVPDVRPGDLVRAGPTVGRIVSMTEKKITVDHGHPFGGETLMCEVLAEPVPKGESLKASKAGE